MNINNKYIKLTCGCGGEIFELPIDWTCHIEHRGWLRTIRHILLTKIEWKKSK